MTMPPLLRLLLVLAVALFLSTACATSGPILNDEQRCARFSGVWQGDTCKSASTLVEVSAFVVPGALVEIEATAILGASV